MIGEAIFGGLIYAIQGTRPYLERGWVKRCPPNSKWNIQPRNDVGTRECGFNPIKHEVKCNAC